jgi:hypothetical protein
MIPSPKGNLYKVPPTLMDALEYRLKREGLVEVGIVARRSSRNKSLKVSRYSITQKDKNYYRAGLPLCLLFNDSMSNFSHLFACYGLHC